MPCALFTRNFIFRVFKTLLGVFLTSQDGFVAAVAARGVLPGAALAAHDAVVLGAERLLGQRLVTLHTAETLLVPVPALMAELLVEAGTVLVS